MYVKGQFYFQKCSFCVLCKNSGENVDFCIEFGYNAFVSKKY